MPCVANIHYEIPFVKGCGVFYKKMILGVSLRKTGASESFLTNQKKGCLKKTAPIIGR